MSSDSGTAALLVAYRRASLQWKGKAECNRVGVGWGEGRGGRKREGKGGARTKRERAGARLTGGRIEGRREGGIDAKNN